MLIIVGKYLGTSTRRVEPKPGQTWEAFDDIKATLLMERDDFPPYTLEVQLAGKDVDVAALPDQGQYVAFECSVTARAKNDNAYMDYKAWRRSREVEALFGAQV